MFTHILFPQKSLFMVSLSQLKLGLNLDHNAKFETDLESKFGTSSVNSRFPARATSNTHTVHAQP